MTQLPFVDILLPVPIARRYTYRIPNGWESRLARGMRVVVPFGKRRILTGIVDQTEVPAPEKYEARYLLDILDDEPVVTDIQFRLIDWMASYYMCQPGDVVQAMLPSGMKISTTSYVQLHPDREEKEYEKEEIARLIRALQEAETLSYEEAKDILNVSNPFTVIQHLVREGTLLVFDQVKERYHPKIEKYVRLHPEILEDPDAVLEAAFQRLARAPKQEDALMAFLQLISDQDGISKYEAAVPKKKLTDSGISDGAIRSLGDKRIFEVFDQRVGRFPAVEVESRDFILSKPQQAAFDAIMSSFESQEVVLLQGITGSGKTEIYMHLITQVIEQGAQVLYLLPEIALTTQIVSRLRRVFGDKLGVYHSKFSDNERVEVWQGILQHRYQVIIGVRSAVFLPFSNLGLVIIDEEHEHSYKQHDPAPRYHARDTALMLARFHHARVLMGTATPSLESWHLATSGAYGFVKLTERYGNALLPEVEIVDLIKEKRRKKMQGSLSTKLVDAMRQALDQGQQIILFQNRRGYAPYLSCQQCGFIPQCVHCSVSLTYHQYAQALICHYCGSREPVPHTCEACGAHAFSPMGIGTEMLEEEVGLLFPDIRVKRMDLDTTRSKFSYERILQEFAEGAMEVLVGTQMVAKGLDFGNVGLVGIIDLDSLMNYPDFRSYEKTLQLGIQVSGRAGRTEKRGLVMIQTRKPDHPVVQHIKYGHVEEFYASELNERREYKYPPFSRLIRINLKNRDKDVVHEAAHVLAENLRKTLGSRMLGPQEPLINRIRNEYIMELWIKIERSNTDREKIKRYIHHEGEKLKNEKLFRNLKVSYNVDPY